MKKNHIETTSILNGINIKISFVVTLFFLFSCSQEKVSKNGGFTNNSTTQFSKVLSTTSNITFKNVVTETMDFNFLNYPYLYAGGGVVTGDFNNDGLEDIYLVSNFEKNKLYLNEGNLSFKDITAKAKVEDADGFSTGATVLDINNDGWLDIYVSKAGSLNDDNLRRNKLYVNQKDGTFKNEAKSYGLDDPGYTTQAYPVDYDNDGDLDLFVLNYRYDFANNTKISGVIQSQIEETTSDQLYRNDGNTFTKVTGAAGVYNKAWGLSATISDFNGDGWQDIYVANDFLEPDLMYINQQDGTFKNEINNRINHISFNSMGSDYADLNNDLQPDLMTVDMLAENYARSKENMASMSISNFMTMVDIGYHHAYMANMLHMNTGEGSFIETGQLSGVVKTDWSWAPLLADFNNDGLKDIFITNGVFKDYHNQDFRNVLKQKNAEGKAMTLQAVLDLIPSQKMSNYIYQNEGDLKFSKKIKDWGLEDPNFSNGAAYADFDNDGDLDLIVNNVYDEVGFYRNNANENYIQVRLSGSEKNTLALGAKVYIEQENGMQIIEQNLTRGFESSVTPIINFGLGSVSEIKNLYVKWPDGKITTVKEPKANQRINVSYNSAVEGSLSFENKVSKKQSKDPATLALNFQHVENDFYDYGEQLLLPQKQSTKGTGITKADVNGDGLEDFFVGNAAGSAAALYIQKSDGTFTSQNEVLWEQDAAYEDANALFFDADGDNDQDLYVVSAGYELDQNSPLLRDRLYLNDGNGNYSKSNKLPDFRVSGKSIAAGDYDNDGDLDLFVGGNIVPKKYPLAPKSYLLKNENGTFIDVTSSNAVLAEIGMVSDAVFSDYDGDNDLDLLVVGEWMQPTFLNNSNGSFEEAHGIDGLDNTSGWWFAVSAEDFDGDGDQDYMLGNLGTNNKFQPKQDKPIYIYGKDFDNNGSFDVALSKINNGKLVPVRGKECSSEQNPFLLEKIGTYKEFASLEMKDIYGEDRLKDAYKLTTHMLESVYVENLGGGKFSIKKLPNHAQLGPTLSFIHDDFNNDGNVDIMGIGAIYDAEVETIRYDSNLGYVLLGDGKGNFEHNKNYNPFINSDAKDIIPISIKGKDHFIVVSNNAPLEVFSLTP